MHSLGWVHRDASAANILVVNGTAKLADLEYAKNRKENGSHPIFTVSTNANAYEHPLLITLHYRHKVH